MVLGNNIGLKQTRRPMLGGLLLAALLSEAYAFRALPVALNSRVTPPDLRAPVALSCEDDPVPRPRVRGFIRRLLGRPSARDAADLDAAEAAAQQNRIALTEMLSTESLKEEVEDRSSEVPLRVALESMMSPDAQQGRMAESAPKDLLGDLKRAAAGETLLHDLQQAEAGAEAEAEERRRRLWEHKRH